MLLAAVTDKESNKAALATELGVMMSLPQSLFPVLLANQPWQLNSMPHACHQPAANLPLPAQPAGLYLARCISTHSLARR